MTLGRKMALATLVVAVALGCAVAFLAWDSVQQARILAANANQTRVATALAVRVADAAHQESRVVLSVRAPLAGVVRNELATAARDVDELARDVEELEMDASIASVWDDYASTRKTLAAIREEVVDTASRRDEAALDLALQKWTIVAGRGDALLRDFAGYHLRSLDRTIADLQARREKAVALAFVSLLAGIALALASSALVARAVVQPIVAMAQVAERVTATGALSPVTGADRDDELGTLARAFNEMTSRLINANAELSETDRRKDEFLAVLSHELRNPLAPIRSSVALLERADPQGERARAAREIIHRQVDHLAALVDDLLDTTRISRGKVELHREEVDLSALLARAADDHRDACAEKGVTLDCRLPRSRVLVGGDSVRLAQVLGNLLNNAVKFSERGGVVSLALSVDRGAARVTVRDDGVGIHPELLPRVFEPFVQAERSLARSSGGLGLGLPVVKGLVELHGGTVTAASDGLGRGATFEVVLPGAVEAEHVAEPQAQLMPPPARTRDVLVIDDNADAANSLAELVEVFGHRARVAYDAAAGLEQARSSPPDVVLCDLGLPGMDGYAFARAARADPALVAVRLVAVSGYAQAEDRRRSAEAGFDEHVAKPAAPEDIERLLAS